MIISDEAFEYLKWQAGDINDLHADRAKWEAAYAAKIEAQYAEIAPWLPKPCWTVLDIGSGLGGIHIPLKSNHGWNYLAVLLDGDNGRSCPGKSDEPHNSADVARRFLAANGVGRVSCMTPDCLRPVSPDLVLSLAAWCFHFAPITYLDFVTERCKPDSIIILDVRRGKPDWDADLESAFEEVAVIHEARKFQRKVFRLAA